MRNTTLLLSFCFTFVMANSDFPRLTKEQLNNLANDLKLPHRVFYATPSEGPSAEWFDAVKKGDLKKIKLMVEAGQDIEAKDEASLMQTALGWASFIGYLDVVKYLVEKGANIYATDLADVKHSFKAAVLGGNIEVIKYLFPLYKGKLDLNEQDESDGETALMVAAGNGREDAVRFLLEQKADVNVVSRQLRKNALSYACESENPNIVKMITDAGGTNINTGKPSCN